MRKQGIPILLILCLVVQFSFAGTTGKIVGKVSDQATGEALIGANVVLLGTLMGGSADLDGNYFIINVPPGTYDLKFSMMGYTPIQIENVRVSIDLTTKINAELTSTVIESDEAVTIIADRDLVRPDMTSALSSVSGDDIDALPVDNVNDVLELQAGIVESGGNIHIRGGRSGEIAYWVDGVAVTDIYNGNMGVVVENSSIQELQVISGTFNAEYGQAMSGIVNIITNEGGSKYRGHFSGYVGDYLSNGMEFDVIDRIETNTASDGTIDAVAITESPLTKWNPIYNGEFSLSGPVPLLGNKVSFFVTGRHMSNEGYLYGKEWFKPTGVPGDSSLVPMNPYQRTSAQAKLTFRPSGSLKLNYNVFWNEWENTVSFWGGGNLSGHDMRYVPNGLPHQESKSISHILSLNHVLSPRTFYEIRVNRFNSEFKRYVFEDINTVPKYYIRVAADSTTGLEEMILDPDNNAHQATIDSVKNYGLTYNYFIDPDGPVGYLHPDSTIAPASNSLYDIGMDMRHFFRSTSYWVGKLDLTSQVNQKHQIKTGVEFRQYELELDDITLRPKTTASGEVIPFEPDVQPVSSIYHDYYLQKPIEMSAYLQDKIEVSDMIMNIGVRFDYFDAKASIPVDPSDTNVYNPFKSANKYVNPDAPEDERVEYTVDERREFMLKDVDAKWRISPRVGIAYPITDRGVIHFSYGHFFQIPEFQYLYVSPEYKFTSGGGATNRLFGNPDLEPQKTVMYEIGLQQQLTNDLGLDVTVFYRDVRDWAGASPLIDTPLPDTKYSIYENKDYSNVRGVTFKLDKRYANNFAAKLDYTYQVAEGTYSNPIDAFNAIQNQDEPRKQLIAMGWDQRHTLNASLVFRVAGWTASLIGRYWSGRPYTPNFPRGTVTGAAATVDLEENTARLPSQKKVDLYLDRNIALGALNFNLFIRVYNLFDQRDETSVYSDTGSSTYTTYTNPAKIPYDPNRIGTVEYNLIQPSWYVAPREIQAGVEVHF